MLNLKLLLALVFCVMLWSCNQEVVHTDYHSFSEGWASGDTLAFNFEAPDTIMPYHLFFNVRVNQDYKFDNMYLITSIQFPNGKTIGDTLEYEMAYPNGELMGVGLHSVKESKLWYKSGVVFSEKGRYQIQIKQAMRKLGDLKALDTLEGVMDFGIRIESVNLKEY